MIKIFRNIRKALLDEGKTTKYFKYAIGEIILVVIGILIALQLNALKENKQNDAIRQVYYHQLLEDLEKDKIYIESMLIQIDSLRATYNTYLKSYTTPNLSVEQVIGNMSTLIWSSIILVFNISTIESLQNSGDIKLIPPTIRNKLIDLKRSQNLTTKIQTLNDEGKNNLAQKLSMETGSPTLRARLINQPELNAMLGGQSNVPKIFLLVEAVQDWKSISEMHSKIFLKKILIDNKKLVELITNELEK